ncbi:hypothetical protein D3H34_14450 [Acidovorax cavernicola]|uniref:Uncharacterized protein n=1 Tax=Acidovorax cavernicola TaxID=1675792 RepID=A0A9X8GUU1_9BURK|nr:hypothetical protein D3H34_14450 [Acidovorax cavernicola]
MQLSNLARCKKESETVDTTGFSSGARQLTEDRDTRIFFAGDVPQIAQPWYPAALKNAQGGWDPATVSRAATDTYVACFLQLGYTYSTFKQKLGTTGAGVKR